MTILLTITSLETMLISIILISVILNIFQFVQIKNLINERNQYFNIIINTKFTNEEPERKPIGFTQYQDNPLCIPDTESSDKLSHQRQSLSIFKFSLPGHLSRMRELHKKSK